MEMTNRMYLKVLSSSSKRFHHHNSRIYTYNFGDYGKQIEFWSYSTPILVISGKMCYLNKRHYSPTTTRQTNRYCREAGIDKEKCILKEEYEIRQLCKY